MTAPAGTAPEALAPPRKAISLSLFAMPVGVTGFGAVWSTTFVELGAPEWPDEVLYGVAATMWLAFTSLYLIAGIRGRVVFSGDLKHPLAGPFAAYLPLAAILLSAHYSQYAFVVFAWLCAASILLLVVVAAKLMAHWLAAGVDLESVHPGYLIPVVAGPNVASIGLSTIGQHELALGAFGGGLFFWVVIGSVVLSRLFAGGRLPLLLTPALSAFLAAAGTSNLAWAVAHPGQVDQTQVILTGVLVFMIAVQGALLDEYRKVPFGQSWWIFTFPLASTANYGVRWMADTRIAWWQAWSWGFVAVSTAFFLYVALGTLLGALGARGLRVLVLPRNLSPVGSDDCSAAL